MVTRPDSCAATPASAQFLRNSAPRAPQPATVICGTQRPMTASGARARAARCTNLGSAQTSHKLRAEHGAKVEVAAATAVGARRWFVRQRIEGVKVVKLVDRRVLAGHGLEYLCGSDAADDGAHWLDLCSGVERERAQDGLVNGVQGEHASVWPLCCRGPRLLVELLGDGHDLIGRGRVANTRQSAVALDVRVERLRSG